MSLKICIAQLNYCVGDMAGNARLIIAAARQAYEAGARLVLTPELAICGYAAEDLFLRPAIVQACDDDVNEVARELSGLKGLHVVVGSPMAVPQAEAPMQQTRSVQVPQRQNVAHVLCEGLRLHSYGRHSCS